MAEAQREPTGRHALSVEEKELGWRDKALTIVLAALIGGGGGLVMSSSDGARLGQRLDDLERRAELLEAQRAGVEEVRRDLAALAATVTTQNTAFREQLQRIEAKIDDPVRR